MNQTTLIDLLNEHDDVTENLEPLTFIHDSPYLDGRELIQLAKQHANKYFILRMNCQCLNAKLNELLIYIYHLKSEGLEFGAICLHETWIGDDNGSLYEIPRYKNVFQMVFYPWRINDLKYTINYDIIDTPNYNTWETQFIEIRRSDENKRLIIGNLYRPPLLPQNWWIGSLNRLMLIINHWQISRI
jgi:hypothetical protein